MTTLQTALRLPGMKAHINRMKAVWKDPKPSQTILSTWVKHKLAKELYADILKQDLPDVLAMHQSGIHSLTYHALITAFNKE